MARITCPKCGASVDVVRTGLRNYKTSYGSEFNHCTVARDRLIGVETTVPEGECANLDNAIASAVQMNRV